MHVAKWRPATGHGGMGSFFRLHRDSWEGGQFLRDNQFIPEQMN